MLFAVVTCSCRHITSSPHALQQGQLQQDHRHLLTSISWLPVLLAMGTYTEPSGSSYIWWMNEPALLIQQCKGSTMLL